MHIHRPALLAATALVASLAAGTADAAERLRVMFQGAPLWQAMYAEIAQRFEAANPAYDVELIYAAHDVYNEKLGAAVMAKDLPDIIHIDAPFLANYVWSGFLRPITPYIDPALIADMTTSNIAQGTYPIDGKLYAIGLTDSSVVLYANRRYLAQIGARIPKSVEDAWTGAELEDVMAKLAKVQGVRWPIDLFRGSGVKTEWVTYAYSPIFQSMGCDLIDRKTWKAAGTLDSKACVEAAAMLQRWVSAGWVVPQSAGTNQFYAEGNPAALALGGHWTYAEAVKSMGDDLVVLPMPRFGERSVSPNGTWVWGVTTASKSPEAAGKWISFLIEDEAYRNLVRERTGFPGMASFAATSPIFATGGPMAIAYEQAGKTAVQRPPHPAYPTLTLAFMEAIDAVFNKTSPAAALGKAAKRIDTEIKDNDGYPPFDQVKR